jgi:hypothetical protein
MIHLQIANPQIVLGVPVRKFGRKKAVFVIEVALVCLKLFFTYSGRDN